METPKGWGSHRWEEQGSSQIILREHPERSTFCLIQAKLTPIYSTAAASPPRNEADRSQTPEAASHSRWNKGTGVVRMEIFQNENAPWESISSSEQPAPALPGLFLPLDTARISFLPTGLRKYSRPSACGCFIQLMEKRDVPQFLSFPIVIVPQLRARRVLVWLFQLNSQKNLKQPPLDLNGIKTTSRHRSLCDVERTFRGICCLVPRELRTSSKPRAVVVFSSASSCGSGAEPASENVFISI